MTTDSQLARRFVVERAAAGDAASIAPLFDAYRQFYGAAPDPGAAHAFIAQRLERGESVVLLARSTMNELEPGQVVGFAQLYPSFSSVSLAPIIVLNDLFVLPSWRRSGIARALVTETARHGERVGAIRIHLSTQSTNASAQRLYRSLDFVLDEEFMYMSLAVNVPASAS
jgi:ribosomal protein S18 acetylase RimI-like enzyme